MSVEEAKADVAAIRKTAARIGTSPESIRAFLIKHKILTPKGKLAGRFRA